MFVENIPAVDFLSNQGFYTLMIRYNILKKRENLGYMHYNGDRCEAVRTIFAHAAQGFGKIFQITTWWGLGGIKKGLAATAASPCD